VKAIDASRTEGDVDKRGGESPPFAAETAQLSEYAIDVCVEKVELLWALEDDDED
jgi:hypothetical protein